MKIKVKHPSPTLEPEMLLRYAHGHELHTNGFERIPAIGQSTDFAEKELSDERVLLLMDLDHILVSGGDDFHPQENAPTAESAAAQLRVRPEVGELIASLLQEPRCLFGLTSYSSFSTEEAFKLLEKVMPPTWKMRSTTSGRPPTAKTQLAWFVEESGTHPNAMFIFNRVDDSSDIDELDGVWGALRDSGCGSFGLWNTVSFDKDVYQYHEALDWAAIYMNACRRSF